MAGCASGRYSLNDDCKVDYCYKIENVPFIPQKENYCGPAALAMVMNYYEADITQDEIAKEVYTSELAGTLSMELLLYPIQKGFEAEMYNGNIEDLKEKIRARFPLIVSVKDDDKAKAHYMVVWGYDEWNKRIFVYSGYKNAQVIEYKRFTEIWEKADYLTFWIYPKPATTTSLK